MSYNLISTEQLTRLLTKVKLIRILMRLSFEAVIIELKMAHRFTKL